MSTQGTVRRILVVGGTGMLAPLCRALPPQQLAVAARFVSNAAEVAALSPQVLRIPLNYRSERSAGEFLKQLVGWGHLACCILWVHSRAHRFSRTLIETVSRRTHPPHVVHVFGQGTPSDALTDWASQCSVPFSAIRLGSVATATGWRWLTHAEISQQTASALTDTFPDLRISVGSGA